MKKIAILGSTGSIGVNTLDVLSRLKGAFRVAALSADSNVELLAAQARRFRPDTVAIGNGFLASKVKKLVPAGTRVLPGPEGLREIAADRRVEMVVFAISGNACLAPLLEAIRRRKRIALANKEALVSAGPLVTGLAKASGVRILPVDSEHSAIFQCIDGSSQELSRIYLTGSGGPLLDVSAKRFDSLPARMILKHPKWNMGRKISVDSATMMNKGLEIIEAQALFGLDEERIEVLIHPEAIIHSMVEFSDGAVLAQLAVPDMRLPIQYALTYPARAKACVRRVDFTKLGSLTFRAPDVRKFPCLGLARQAARSGGTAPAVLCAADEEAVKCYLEGNIKFSGIPKTIEKVLSRHRNVKGGMSVNDILDADAWAREEARSFCCH
jgi:1-deoxy-D-xylulose-5-phosphate reductoisomerase